MNHLNHRSLFSQVIFYIAVARNSTCREKKLTRAWQPAATKSSSQTRPYAVEYQQRAFLSVGFLWRMGVALDIALDVICATRGIVSFQHQGNEMGTHRKQQSDEGLLRSRIGIGAPCNPPNNRARSPSRYLDKEHRAARRRIRKPTNTACCRPLHRSSRLRYLYHNAITHQSTAIGPEIQIPLICLQDLFTQ